MGSTSKTSGSGTVSTLTGGMILVRVGIIIIAFGKLFLYVVHGLGQRSPATAGVNRGAEITGTGEPPLVQVQVNEIVASASSGGTNETATDLVAIEAPPHSSSHQTDVQYMLADVFTTTYHMVAGLKPHNSYIITGCVMDLLFAAGP